jgi:chromosome segregation ATPase
MSSDSEASLRTAEARAAVTASLTAVGGSVDTEIRTRAADLHANSEAIKKQEKEVAKQTAALAKQSAQWQKLADTSTKKLNEIGDIQNWAEMIERDLLVLEETLRLAEGKTAPDSASGTGGTNGWAQ